MVKTLYCEVIKRDHMKTFKTRTEMASELGISYQTLRRLIKKKQLPISSHKLLSPRDQEIIRKSFFEVA